MLLSIKNLTFGWQEKPLFEAVDCQLNEEEIIHLSGENGSGKTTLLKLIAGMIPHFFQGKILTGNIEIRGKSIRDNSPKNFYPHIAFIPSVQLELFLLTESLAQELLLTRGILKINEPTLSNRSNEFSQFFPGINDLFHLPFKTMPMQQQVLALTFIFYLQKAQLYLFDEVISGVGETSAVQWYSFFDWVASKGSSVIFVDHQPRSHGYQKWLLENKKLFLR
jgi:ABC-type Mn2+/Zn2+ transport system ATPase subunit